MDKNAKIHGIVFDCDDRESFKNILYNEIPEDYNIIAIKNDFTNLITVPSCLHHNGEDIESDTALGYKYVLFVSLLLSNPEHRKVFDRYIDEVMKDYYSIS